MSDTAPIDHFHAIIPAGGSGTRLWPLSRTSRPKFLLDPEHSGRSLLQRTWDRLEPLCEPGAITVVCGVAHVEQIVEQLPDSARVVAEPSARDSMPAIGLASAIIAQRDPDAIVGSFAADHHITDVAEFHATVRHAIEVARRGFVTTIGVEPTHASTAFGYVQAGEPLEDLPGAFAVRRFVEKPDAATAQAHLDAGGYSWNAGMFVARADVLLGHLERLHPVLHGRLVTIARALDTPQADAVMSEHWPATTRIAIDHAIAEPVSLEGGLAVVPGSFDWNDIGDFAAMTELAPQDDSAVWIDASGAVFGDDGRQLVVIGIDDAIVVRTPDAILVTTREHTQTVKQAPARLRDLGRDDLT